ncbi:MAG: TonB-dependent receptor [Sphingomicrobium sp.]
MIFSDAPPQAQDTATIVVVGTRTDAEKAPNTKEGETAEQLKVTNNVRNVEDSLRYFPSLLVRKRHIGDTQAPLATRTSGVGASARSLIYADGVLLSALIGNNNSFASPRWGMISPEEIQRVDVLYGPFSAAYPGNSIGAVVNFATRMPDKLEMSASAAANVQSFDQYDTHGKYPAYQLAGTIGDKAGPFSWFVAANHADSRSQPLAYVTIAQPAATSASGLPVTGAIEGRNRTGQPIYTLGAGGFEHHLQDNVRVKLAVDLTPSIRAIWQTGLFLNDTASHSDTYLSGVDGEVFAGVVNIDGRRVAIAASSFSNQVYRLDQRHWMHALTIEGEHDALSWSLIGSVYVYGRDKQRIPSTALPAAEEGGAGSIVQLDGTGWRTIDAKLGWRALAAHDLNAGVHYDQFALSNRRFAAEDWRGGDEGVLTQESAGHTRTIAMWAQDQWRLAPKWSMTVGARYEWWRAYDGFNFSSAPALNVDQPSRSLKGLSPKASLRWLPAQQWSVTLSAARALRFPTVTELYQAISTGPTLSVPNPDLKPESGRSAELSIERRNDHGKVRLSLFAESVRDALLSQTAPLVPGSTTLFNFVQNIGRTRTKGIEVAFDRRDLLLGFDLAGSATFVDPKIVSDPLFEAAEGKMIPQVPRRKATLVATWRPSELAALTLAGRYASRSYGTIDNSDVVGHTYQGFEPYLLLDARASLRLQRQWRLAVGVENLTDKRYFLFHPFPGRTLTAEVGWAL